MAISDLSSDAGVPLLEHTVHSCVDYRGRPVHKSSSGGWRSAYFIIAVEMAERFAYYGILSNLISYLTGPLGQSTATAAENVNVWSGTMSLLPLFGAFVADSFLGRYRTIIVASVVYVLGMGLLTLSALLPSLSSSDCQNTNKFSSCSPYESQVILFFLSLYIVALGHSGHKPCVQAFGADQFDEHDPEECKLRSSFFNWWYFGICVVSFLTYLIINYIQDNLSWGLGFGIPCICIIVGLLVFLLGTKTYRYGFKRNNEKTPFVRIGQVFVAAFRNRQISPSAMVVEEEAQEILSEEQFKFLNKALFVPDGSNKLWKVCSIRDVEDVKALLRLVPIWTTSLVYGIVLAQSSTFFTKQGATMDRSVIAGFNLPAASIQSIISLSILVTMPVYDRVFVPGARVFTGKPSGITMLQRIGTGLFLSAMSMVTAALVEMKRLKTVEKYELFDELNVTVPMSVWWLVPQYALIGVSETFAMVGLQEFFYDQVPTELRSVGLSLNLSIFGFGSFLSSFLISVIDKITGGDGQDSWFADNLNQAHIDYFYWLLGGINTIGLMIYLHFSKPYIYKREFTCRNVAR
ncbi:hypothetical protein Dsin_001670 [Dipteronia sinensis]|uniref:Protein NRT1/ PTR FAMILY 5.10-like n=1 Tax=Dipteronia sinensis TaxID=43782 RepID=A0AAE0B629_9ROSI|nr:hypothetical protein Dsin_001670 [Dipteronia sinensis]